MNLSILHTSASLTVQENASKDVLNDIRIFLSNLAPESANYLHDVEGPDDMPAHLKTLIILSCELLEGCVESNVHDQHRYQ